MPKYTITINLKSTFDFNTDDWDEFTGYGENEPGDHLNSSDPSAVQSFIKEKLEEDGIFQWDEDPEVLDVSVK